MAGPYRHGGPCEEGTQEPYGRFPPAGIDDNDNGRPEPYSVAIGKELNLSQDKQLEILDSTHLPIWTRKSCGRSLQGPCLREGKSGA